MVERIIDFSARNRFIVLLLTAVAVAMAIQAMQNVPLDAMSPESHRGLGGFGTPQFPSHSVTVCETNVLFCQVTVSPTVIVVVQTLPLWEASQNQ